MSRYSVTTETHPDGHIIYLLRDSESGAAARIIPALGANCMHLELADVSGGNVRPVINDMEFVKNLAEQPFRYGIPILFPWASGVAGNAFSFQGKTIRLRDEGDKGACHHGFVYNAPWSVVDSSSGDENARLTCAIDSKNCTGLAARFPFSFRLQFSWTLTAGRLDIAMSATNTGTSAMPLGLGLHPYFTLPLGKAGQPPETTLRVDTARQWNLEGLMKVTPGAPAPAEPYMAQPAFAPDGRPIGTRNFNEVYVASHTPDGRTSALITDPSTGNKVRISGDKAISTWVIYTPRDRAAISLEPWTHTPNAMNLAAAGVKDTGLVALQPGERWNGHVQITTA